DDFTVGLAKAVAIQLIDRDPCPIAHADALWWAADVLAGESMQRDAEVCEAVPHDGEQLADAYLNRQFLAQVALQAFRQAFIRLLFAAGKFPPAAEQTLPRALCDEQFVVLIPNDARRHVVMRGNGTRRFDRALVLRAVLVGETVFTDWTLSAQWIAWLADGAAQLHQRLIVITGA